MRRSAICVCVACAMAMVSSSAGAATSYSSEVLRDNPRFYWNFDEPMGDALEQVRFQANDQLAPIAGAGRVEHSAIGSGLNLGSAITLDGALQQFRAANLADGEMAGAWAIELWVQAQGPGITPAGSSGARQDYLVNPGDAGTNNPALIYDYTTDNRVGLFSGAGRTDNVAGAPTIDDNDWHHMVFTFYGNGTFGVADRVDVAFDGAVSTIPRGGFSSGFNLNNGMIIGSAVTTGAGGFEGLIDEVAFYDLSGLTEAQVAGRVADLAGHHGLAQTLSGDSTLFKVDPAGISYTYDPNGVQPFNGAMRDDNAAGMPGTGKLIDGVIASTNSGANLSDGSTIGYNDPSGFNGDNGAPHPGVTFDLGGLFELDQLWIDYIGAGSAAGVAAPDSVDVLFSTDGVTFANMMTFDHFNDTLSTFANFSSRRLVAELDGAMATHVRLDFFNNQEWTFLSEVQFVARSPVIPEPASAALLGLAGVALTLRRRTCRT